jgi:hypothetical protein
MQGTGRRARRPRPAGEFIVRTILTILVPLALIGWMSCHFDPPSTRQAAVDVAERPGDWRRTASGWEQADEWWRADPSPAPSVGSAISPAFVALLEVGISVAALLAFPPGAQKNFQKLPPPSTETPAGRH